MQIYDKFMKMKIPIHKNTNTSTQRLHMWHILLYLAKCCHKGGNLAAANTAHQHLHKSVFDCVNVTASK